MSTEAVASAADVQRAKYLVPNQWKPGQSGNPAGRQPGLKQAIGDSFLRDLHADWKEHGKEALTRARLDDPAAYVRVVAGLLPKEFEFKGSFDGLDDNELLAAIGALATIAAGRCREIAGASAADADGAIEATATRALPALPEAA